MSIINHIYDSPIEQEIKKCSHCGELYYCSETEQIPCYRDMEYDVCPYCNTENNRSMTFEYHCRKLSEEDIAYLKKKGVIKTDEA